MSSRIEAIRAQVEQTHAECPLGARDARYLLTVAEAACNVEAPLWDHPILGRRCALCLGESSFGMPRYVRHAPDCPWLALQAAIAGEDGR